jgi:hypothetical protein
VLSVSSSSSFPRCKRFPRDPGPGLSPLALGRLHGSQDLGMVKCHCSNGAKSKGLAAIMCTCRPSSASLLGKPVRNGENMAKFRDPWLNITYLTVLDADRITYLTEDLSNPVRLNKTTPQFWSCATAIPSAWNIVLEYHMFLGYNILNIPNHKPEIKAYGHDSPIYEP